MRQHDEKEFCEVLNRLRKAQCTQADHDLFQSCIVDKNSTKYNPYVRHIYPFRNAVDKHNEEIFDKAKEFKEIVESQDFLIGTHSHEELTKCLMKLKTRAKYELISGLHRNLKLAVNCVYAISCNVNTHDGLINGAICTLKYVEYINQQTTVRPSILWVHFSDATVGTQQRKRYKMFYHEGISFCWTLIFAASQQFFVGNAKGTRTQFPVAQAAATTIHKCQGSTLEFVCIDMDVSPSEKFAKNPEKAKAFYQHAHYVAASCVRSLKGLQIIKWNPDLISINEEVQSQLDYLYSHSKLQICYTPVYEMIGTYLCSFLNTHSLHLHFKDISSNHNMLASDIVILCETCLMKTDSSIELMIHGFSCIIRNDQISSSNSCPPHGLAAYVKTGIKVIEFQKYSSDQFEAIYMCLCSPDDMKPVQIIGVYASPTLQWDVLKEEINRFMHNIDTTSARTFIVGDFNMKSIMSKSINYNQNITDYMFDKYNMKQFVHDYTMVHNSTLDLCFSRDDIVISILWNHWSDHKIISFPIM